MFYKKYLNSIRNWLMTLFQLLMTALLVLLNFSIPRQKTQLEPLEISLSYYDSPIIILERFYNTSDLPELVKLAQEYEKFVTNTSVSKVLTMNSTEFQDYILKLYETEAREINTKYVAAVSFTRGNIIAWLNCEMVHSAPLTINLIHNAMARAYLGEEYRITVTNNPLPLRPETQIQGENTDLTFPIMLSSCFVTAVFVLFLIKERVSRAKLLQFVGGVKVWTFWAAQFIWDYVFLLIIFLLFLTVAVCFQKPNYSKFEEISRIFVVCMFFGASVLPCTYLMANLYSEPAIGFGRLAILNLFMGLVLPKLIGFIEELKALKPVMNAYPHYALMMALIGLNENNNNRVTCDKMCELTENKECTAKKFCDSGFDKCCCKYLLLPLIN